MTHLEQLVYEYYNWCGYLVKNNIKVGRLKHGGWEMELDIVAYNPKTNHLIHLEPSLDSHTWLKRETRFRKKFDAGKKYILEEIFKWLKSDTKIDQIAIINSHPKNKNTIGGGQIYSIDEFIKKIHTEVNKCGRMGNNAIPELYPLLRTIQLVTNGYYKKL